jgi:hypothetical protein
MVRLKEELKSFWWLGFIVLSVIKFKRGSDHVSAITMKG